MTPSNVRSLFDLWPREASTFIVAGTADDLEARAVREAYPHVECVGVEPNPEYARRQREELRFPGRVHEVALWRHDAEALTLSWVAGRPVVGSVCRPWPSPDLGDARPGPSVPVAARTLDSLDREFGPWQNVVLWLDVEFAEVAALEGAAGLLPRVLLANVETYAGGGLADVTRLMAAAGLKLARVWNVGDDPRKDAQDYVFVRG